MHVFYHAAEAHDWVPCSAAVDWARRVLGRAAAVPGLAAVQSAMLLPLLGLTAMHRRLAELCCQCMLFLMRCDRGGCPLTDVMNTGSARHE